MKLGDCTNKAVHKTLTGGNTGTESYLGGSVIGILTVIVVS